MQEYKSLRVWAMIRVNTQTHRQASVDRLYYYFSQLSEKKLNSVFLCRLSEQARRQLEKTSTKFEDLSLGDRRPTQLIRRYGNLYTEGRLDALDALDDVTEMTEFSDLKGKLLLTILVVSLPAGHLDTDCFTCDTWIMTGFRRQQ